MVQQSNEYFERCHAADYDPKIAMDRKQDCWARWLEHYTLEQPPERVAYAEERLAALERGETLPPLPGLDPVGDTQKTTFLTAGTGTEGPQGDDPPAPADRAEGPTPPAGPPAPPDRQEGSPCNGVCEPRWEACVAHCDERPRDCVKSCEIEHRTCMRGCF